jgi:ATPase family associated with various cellular activities (AAA)
MIAEEQEREATTAPDSLNPIAAAVERTRALLEGQGADGTCPLRHLAHSFELSPFELDLLILCAAVELDSEAADLCAAVQGDARLRYPTFRLAFSALANSHWSAAVPQGALRAWRLIEPVAGESLMSASLRLDEWVLHYLMGVTNIDDRLDPLVETIAPPGVLPASYAEATQRLATLWRDPKAPVPVAILAGNASRDKRKVAAAAGALCGMRVRLLDSARIPSSAGEREALIRLLERDCVLNGSGILIEVSEPGTAGAFAARFNGRLAIAANAHFNAGSRPSVLLTIDRPTPEEQAALWRHALGEEKAASCNGALARIANQFSFDSETILETGRRIASDPEADLWHACRTEARPLLDGLAQRIVTGAGWADLVLPQHSLETLRAMTAQVRNQDTVLRCWGLADGTSRGLGVSALFYGQSGTGKTLAAEVIANELRLDLYRIDLSQVVSKYIGETEKNLRAVFDGAENTGAVLLFDEADALFGKRSEVRDSHDRFANIEVGYLLQRMEAYRGIALLTTNMRAALDTSFLRRIRFTVQFPFPDLTQRRGIWMRMFPPNLPVEGIDYDKLARLNLPGGNIRNIALGAAFIAAEAGESVRMKHLLTAARRECGKLERALTEAEVGGWA